MIPDTAAPRAMPRLRAAWTAAHTPLGGVPRWARLAAGAIPLVVLPSSIWRIVAVTFHAPIFSGPREGGELPSWLPVEVYVVLLSIGSELLAFAAVGLVAAWGEVFPRWIPWLGGRRVPTLFAVIPAAVGAVTITAVSMLVTVNGVLGRDVQGRPMSADNPLNAHEWEGVIVTVAYAPLLLWGPLLGAVTVAYWRRRARGRVLDVNAQTCRDAVRA